MRIDRYAVLPYTGAPLACITKLYDDFEEMKRVEKPSVGNSLIELHFEVLDFIEVEKVT